MTREYAEIPHRHRLVATPFYEESSPLETVMDVELGIRVNEMLDIPEDLGDILWLCRWNNRKRG
jgi:hypothetical protein